MGAASLPDIARQVEFHATKIAALELRIEDHDEQIGSILREASAAHTISRRVLDEVLNLRGLIAAGFEKQEKECDIRHRPIDRRLDRIEDHSDKLSDKVYYSEGDITKVQGREELVGRVKHAEKERGQFRNLMIGAIVTTVTTIGTVITAYLASK